jgi:hypothetical protein
MEALLEGLKSCGKRTTICQVSSEDRPGNSKAGPEELEANMDTFEERSSKMDATDLKEKPGETEAAVVWQELYIKKDERRQYRVIGGSIWRSTLGCTTSPRGK